MLDSVRLPCGLAVRQEFDRPEHCQRWRRYVRGG